jgi:hypothetical protein
MMPSPVFVLYQIRSPSGLKTPAILFSVSSKKKTGETRKKLGSVVVGDREIKDAETYPDGRARKTGRSAYSVSRRRLRAPARSIAALNFFREAASCLLSIFAAPDSMISLIGEVAMARTTVILTL